MFPEAEPKMPVDKAGNGFIVKSHVTLDWPVKPCAVVEKSSSYTKWGLFPYRAVAKLPEMEVILRNQVLEDQTVFYDHYKILGNSPPTPPLCQYFAVSEKSVLTMGCAANGVGWGGVQFPTIWETSLLAFIGEVPAAVCQTVNMEAIFSITATWLLCRESCFKYIFRSMKCLPLPFCTAMLMWQ